LDSSGSFYIPLVVFCENGNEHVIIIQETFWTPALIPSSGVKKDYQVRLLDQDILSYWAYRKEACLVNSFE
jgi:hypothetical protein